MAKAQQSAGVVGAVERDLAAFESRLPGASASALALVALALARELDVAGNSATSKAFCAQRLMEALDRLRTSLPQEETQDELDDLSARRERRLAGRAKAAR